MAWRRLTLGILAGAFALTAFGVAPASAEFFGCNEPRTKVSYSSGYYPKRHDARDYRSAYAAQHPRQTTYSSRRADRHQRPNWWR